MAIAEAEHDNADLDQKYQTGPAHHQETEYLYYGH